MLGTGWSVWMLRRFSRTAIAVSGLLAVVVGIGVSAASSTVASAKATSNGAPVVTGHGGCGTVPKVAPNDPHGLLAKLGPAYVSSYVGFRDYALAKSPWVNWKPKKKTGWKVEVVWEPLNNPVTIQVLSGLEAALKASHKVSTIQVQAMDSFTDVPEQIQQMQTAIQRKPDLIVLFPASPSTLVPEIETAAKDGIPTISEDQTTPNKYAVSVEQNQYLNAALSAAGALQLMGGKGSVVEVHGIPGIATEAETVTAWQRVLSRCPNVTVAASVYGDYADATAKSVTQEFLATHPGQLAGAFDGGTMGLGILQGFDQTGRTVPPLAVQSATQGVLAYWHDHSGTKMVATLNPIAGLGTAAGQVAVKMLEGDGVKLDTILGEAPYVVTQSNLKHVWKPSFQEGSTNFVAEPQGLFMPMSYLNGFFVR